MPYFPSKKLIIVASFILLSIAGWFFLFRNSDVNKKDIFGALNKESFVSGLFQEDESQKDADNDGLRNWEETLWKTDQNNPDTDGDGAADGEEISRARDPNKPGPDDKLTDISGGPAVKNNSEQTQQINKTDILAREFFSSFLSLYQSGGLQEKDTENLTEYILSSLKQETLADKYKISELNLIKTSKESLKNYGNEIGRIIKEYNFMRKEDDLTLINRALQNQDEEELKELDFLIGLYQKTALDLLNLKIPQGLIQYHLSLLNAMFNFSEAIKNIKQVFNDPARTLIGIQQYQTEYQTAERSLQDISKYFSQSEVFFEPNDPGYFIFISNRK